MTDIKTLIEARAASDPRLKAVLKKIKEGTATFKDTAYYAEVYSSITGKVFSANVLDLVETEREDVCEELLRGNYEEINNICAQVQTALDEAAGIHIKPQRAAFPTDRVDQIAHSLLDPTVKDSVIKRRANTGVANVSQGFHDSYIKVNASFRNDAGLKVHINRETDGKCCEWCTKIAGRYSYGTEPDDIYRRHDNCGCTVTYENGKQRQDVWSKRSWTAPEVGAGAPPPIRFTPEQAAEIQARNMPTRLTNGQRSGIIEEREREQEFNVPYGKYSVNADMDYINSAEFAAKFDSITDNAAVNSSLRECAKEAIAHRNGTKYEDMYFIHAETGEILAKQIEMTYPSGIYYNDEITSLLKKAKKENIPLVTLHNHPEGYPPSVDDINKSYDNKTLFGIAVGHNGQVYKYDNPGKRINNPKLIHDEIAYRYREGADIDRAYTEMYDILGIKYSIIKGG